MIVGFLGQVVGVGGCGGHEAGGAHDILGGDRGGRFGSWEDEQLTRRDVVPG
jgi:hypothetical protein